LGWIDAADPTGGSLLHMASFIYRCPATGQDVQAWITDDAPANEANVYEDREMSCLHADPPGTAT
jgi:hypothetical protein